MQIRAATLDDVARLAEFMGRCTLAHQGVRRASEDEIRQRLTRPGTDPALDSWLAEDGDVIGFAQVWAEPADVVCYVRVDPEHRARGSRPRSSSEQSGGHDSSPPGRSTRRAGRRTKRPRRFSRPRASSRSATSR